MEGLKLFYLTVDIGKVRTSAEAESFYLTDKVKALILVQFELLTKKVGKRAETEKEQDVFSR